MTAANRTRLKSRLDSATNFFPLPSPLPLPFFIYCLLPTAAACFSLPLPNFFKELITLSYIVQIARQCPLPYGCQNVQVPGSVISLVLLFSGAFPFRGLRASTWV